MVALTALSIDIMLPALPAIGEHFGVGDPNDRQTVVTSYMLGFAIGQMVAGPVSDRYGRKPIILAGLLLFAVATVAAVATTSYGLLLGARFVQGLGGAAPRVVSVAIVRDLFAGRQMARVMSFIIMVFIMVPVFAPAIGGVLIGLGDWTWTFACLLVTGLVAMAWAHLRMPETRHVADRLELTLASVGGACRQVVTTRVTMVYAIAMGLMFGCLLAYVASAQQIFVDTYGLGDLFPLAFGAVALSMAVSSFANAQLVERLGMRRMSHMALAGFVAVAGALVAIELLGQPTVLTFCVMVGAGFLLFGLIVPNFNALAMEPHGHIAGTASSFLGFFTTAAGAILGWAVGQTYDGTSLPLATGFALLSASALVVVRLGDREKPGPIAA
jgi:DHA1 family bicyclomycin/chloramphenicol resistance-like MFS transporter